MIILAVSFLVTGLTISYTLLRRATPLNSRGH